MEKPEKFITGIIEFMNSIENVDDDIKNYNINKFIFLVDVFDIEYKLNNYTMNLNNYNEYFKKYVKKSNKQTHKLIKRKLKNDLGILK